MRATWSSRSCLAFAAMKSAVVPNRHMCLPAPARYGVHDFRRAYPEGEDLIVTLLCLAIPGALRT